MARLDRLGPAKEIAQLGATLGREFTYELLQAVSPLDEETLQQGLKQLVEAELVYQRGLPPQATLSLQACADSGHGLSVVAQEHTAAVSPADCPGVGGAVSRDQSRRSRSCWPITTPRRVSSSKPFPTGSRQGREPASARPMWKRSLTSPKGWSCSRPCRTRPSAPSKNSRCKSPWVCR